MYFKTLLLLVLQHKLGYSAFLARLGHSSTLLLLYNSPVAQTWKLSISCKTWKPLRHFICTSLSKTCPLCISQACAPLVHVECASLRHSWELPSLLLCRLDVACFTVRPLRTVVRAAIARRVERLEAVQTPKVSITRGWKRPPMLSTLVACF